MTSHKSTPGVAAAAWTEQERELLGAARADRMPSQIEARLREALELQLGAATICGVHAAPAADNLVSRASSPQIGAASSLAGSLRTTSSALDRSTRVSQLFSSKLPLWGVLSALALGSFAYLGLRNAPHTPTAGLVRHGALAANGSENAEGQQAQTASEPQERAAHGAVTPEATNAAASGSGRAAEAAEASGESAASRAASAATSGRGRISDATTGYVAAAGSRRALDGVGDAVAQARAAHGGGESVAQARAAHGGGGRVLGGAREAGAALQPSAADGGERGALGSVGGVSAVAGAPRDGEALRLEAELLDGARRALSRGALQEARQWLGRYAARFERGVLKPERDVLRIELEMRTGADRAAHSHAASFLASYPNHPLRERVRELVASPVTAVE